MFKFRTKKYRYLVAFKVYSSTNHGVWGDMRAPVLRTTKIRTNEDVMEMQKDLLEYFHDQGQKQEIGKEDGSYEKYGYKYDTCFVYGFSLVGE